MHNVAVFHRAAPQPEILLPGVLGTCAEGFQAEMVGSERKAMAGEVKKPK
jgi:hypothetical protein